MLLCYYATFLLLRSAYVQVCVILLLPTVRLQLDDEQNSKGSLGVLPI